MKFGCVSRWDIYTLPQFHYLHDLFKICGFIIWKPASPNLKVLWSILLYSQMRRASMKSRNNFLAVFENIRTAAVSWLMTEKVPIVEHSRFAEVWLQESLLTEYVQSMEVFFCVRLNWMPSCRECFSCHMNWNRNGVIDKAWIRSSPSLRLLNSIISTSAATVELNHLRIIYCSR